MSSEFISKDRKNEIDDAASLVCEFAKKHGADASVSIAMTQGHDLVIANNKVESLEFKGGISIDINWFYNSKTLSYSSSDITKNAILEALKSIQNKVSFLEDDKFSGLPKKEYLAFDKYDLNLYFDWYQDIEMQIALGKSCEDIALNYDNRITQCESVNIGANKSYYMHANTLGLNANYTSSYYNISCCMIAKDQCGNMQRDYEYSISRDATSLDPIKHIAEKSARNTIARLGAKSIKSQKTKVLFSPRMSRSLVSCLLSAISGRSIYKKSSFLCGRLDSKIFPEFVNIVDDPTIPGGLASSYFDNEGVATKKRHLIKNGVLVGYLLSSYSARQLNMVPTGNSGGSHNVCVSASSGNFQEMLNNLGTGLLVTDMMGQGLNLITGDFSKGVFGFWVEGGEIIFPVTEITIASNLIDMYENLLSIGSDIDTQGSIRTGSWLVESMTIAGN